MRHYLLIAAKRIQIFVILRMFISELWRNQMDQRSFLKHSNPMWDWIALCDFLKKSWLPILQQATTLSILSEMQVNLLMWPYNLFLVLWFQSEVLCSEMSIMSWTLHIKVKCSMSSSRSKYQPCGLSSLPCIVWWIQRVNGKMDCINQLVRKRSLLNTGNLGLRDNSIRLQMRVISQDTYRFQL